MTARLPVLALIAALCGACVIVHTDSQTRTSGRPISDATLSQVQAGSTQEYVLALLGEPTRRTTLTDGSAIWKWTHTRTETSSESFILLFSGDRSVETEGATYVEFTPEGVVRHTWRD